MRQFQEGINSIAGRNLEVDAGICMHSVSPTIYIQRSIPGVYTPYTVYTNGPKTQEAKSTEYIAKPVIYTI